MNIPCIVCMNTGSAILQNRDLRLYKCKVCGHLFSDERLSQPEMKALYGKKYFFGDEYYDYIADENIFRKNFRLRLNVLRPFLDPNRHRHLLEIGCAYGFFLDMSKDIFYTVKGIDISEEGIRYAKEHFSVDAICADLAEYNLGTQRFDVVCMWDVLEHLHDPRLYLEKATSYLEGGALIAITTGDIGSLNARLRKDKWRLMHPPTHLHYFSKATLARLLDDLGFDIIYDRYCGFSRSIGTIVHRTLAGGRRWPRLYRFLRNTGFMKAGFYLNLYDIIYVIARKR